MSWFKANTCMYSITSLKLRSAALFNVDAVIHHVDLTLAELSVKKTLLNL